jgi:hypothetical protein
MSQFQGTDLTSAEAIEEDRYTNVLNEEMRDECDNNGYCDDISIPLMLSTNASILEPSMRNCARICQGVITEQRDA